MKELNSYRLNVINGNENDCFHEGDNNFQILKFSNSQIFFK